MCCVIMKKYSFYHLTETSCTESNSEYTSLKPECKCSYLYPSDNAQYVIIKHYLCKNFKIEIIFNETLGAINFRIDYRNIFNYIHSHVFN